MHPSLSDRMSRSLSPPAQLFGLFVLERQAKLLHTLACQTGLMATLPNVNHYSALSREAGQKGGTRLPKNPTHRPRNPLQRA